MPLRRLVDSGVDVAARAVVDALGLPASPSCDGGAGPRPRVVAVMIASVDGRATIDGRSVKLGHPDDRALLREVRAQADAVLVGARTLVAERYATLLDDDQRERRRAAGRAEHPVIATVSRDLSVDPSVPVFAEDVPVVVYAERDGALPGAEVVAMDELTFPALLHDLHERGVRAVACEGGPGLLRELVAQGCLDELLITVAPLLVAGDGPAPLAGDPLAGPPRMQLADVHRADDHLFLRYVTA